ncbi:MAG: efflux RND transporter periplasmic adaptor subunit, partial [Kiritimatiellales bacterium]
MKMNGIKKVICILLAAMVTGCGKKPEGCGDADCHGQAAETSMEQRLTEKCECGVPIYQCDECRYEVGVVKLDASLMKSADGSGVVQTQTVERMKVSEALAVTGEVVLNGNSTVHISPRIAGIVESVSVDAGARVKAGDTLLALASVELGKAVAEYERNRTLSDLSGKILARETRLMEQQVGSGQDVIDAQMAFEQHRTDLKASEQMLRVLGLT